MLWMKIQSEHLVLANIRLIVAQAIDMALPRGLEPLLPA
jgi:hypothetical protein